MFETLTLDQLRLFLTVVEEGSFSAAGRRLDRVQSAVSQGVANLESNLGVALFERTGRRPQLTTVGRLLLVDAQRVFAQVSSLRDRASSIAEGLEAEVSVVVDAIVPAHILVQMCRGFQTEFPTVVLRIHTKKLEQVPEAVVDGSCQLGIAGPVGIDAPELTRRFLAQVALIAVASADHSLARCSVPIPTSAVRDEVQVVISTHRQAKRDDHSVLSAHSWRVADAHTKLALIRAGLGWGNLPTQMVHEHIESGELVQLHLEEWGPKPLLVQLVSIVRTNAPLGPAGQWLLRQLHAEPTQ